MSGRSHLAVDRSVSIWKLRLGSCHSVTWMCCLNSALHAFTCSPLCFSGSRPPGSSFQIFRCRYFPRIFRLRPLCMDRLLLCLNRSPRWTPSDPSPKHFFIRIKRPVRFFALALLSTSAFVCYLLVDCVYSAGYTRVFIRL